MEKTMALIGQSETKPALETEVAHDPAAKDPHDGKTKRNLTMRDRNLIIDAAFAKAGGGADKKEKRDTRQDFKLERVKKLLVAESVWDYFGALDDELFERINDWTGKRNRRRMWVAWRAGTMTKDVILEKYPDFNFQAEPEKVTSRQPELTDEEARGQSSTFWIPNGLDHWILEAIKEMNFDVRLSEYTTELKEKYGLKDEE